MPWPSGLSVTDARTGRSFSFIKEIERICNVERQALRRYILDLMVILPASGPESRIIR